MKRFDIWEEGLRGEGWRGAKYLGTYSGKDFSDACKKFIEEHPEYGKHRLFNKEMDARGYTYK